MDVVAFAFKMLSGIGELSFAIDVRDGCVAMVMSFGEAPLTRGAMSVYNLLPVSPGTTLMLPNLPLCNPESLVGYRSVTGMLRVAIIDEVLSLLCIHNDF